MLINTSHQRTKILSKNSDKKWRQRNVVAHCIAFSPRRNSCYVSRNISVKIDIFTITKSLNEGMDIVVFCYYKIFNDYWYKPLLMKFFGIFLYNIHGYWHSLLNSTSSFRHLNQFKNRICFSDWLFKVSIFLDNHVDIAWFYDVQNKNKCV